ncbi:MAG: molybdopterin molybdotransferase MoeA [Spirochaetes bacterium]|nr:molybdopterin molybdotransferase MoeA [Spirochaetota bacterium]
MIDLDEALALVARTPRDPAEAAVPLAEALGRVLARTVTSPIDSPPFDKSAMDGFAVAADDDAPEFRILDTVAAGAGPGRPMQRGECARIMTGAMLPPGTGRVIRKEYVEERAGTVRLLRPEPGSNVIRRASNLSQGDALLGPKVLVPQDIGILAASGLAEVPVAVPPQAAVLCTGPEIRTPGERLGPGQIYNSNGPQLAAQLAAMRCPCREFGTVADEPAALSRAISAALDACGLLLLTGGVSAGDFDFVPGCLEELGADILFHGVAVKPGKPTLFARRGGTWIFGLPGNPVSTFVIFEVFVRPFLYRRMGIDWTPRTVRGTLGAAVRRRSTERTEFLPVTVRQGVVMPVSFHGSAHLNAFGGADGMIRVEKGVAEVARGTEIDARLF